MIRLFINHIDEENGVVCVSLTSSDGGKIVGEDYKGTYKVNGITRKFPVNLVLHEKDEYFIADGEVKLVREKVDELKSSIRKSPDRS